MQTQAGTILAIDLGTSSVKVLIVGPEGDVVGRGQAAYRTIQARPDQYEQHIEDWLEGLTEAIASARRFAPNASIDAIAVTGQMHGTVMYDANGLALSLAVIWSDRRAAPMMPGLLTALGPSLPTIIGGPLGTGYLAVTLAWFQQHRPQVWHHIRRVSLPVGAIVHALCGEFATDPSDAASTGLLDAQTGEWDAGILETLGISRDWLPRIVPTGATVGQLTPRAAELLDLAPGTPVVVAGGDAPAAAIGGGVLTGDTAMVVVSTGAQVMRPTNTWTPDASGRWHTWPSAVPANVRGDRWLSVGATLNGGRAIDWIHRTLAPNVPLSDLLDSCRDVPAGADGLLFLPYLTGERTPILDPYARGAFVGLSDRHEPRHLARAVLEGICLSIADAVDRMAEDGDLPRRMVLGGGGASSSFRNILASVLGIPLSIPQVQMVSAFGAAGVTAMAYGWRSGAGITDLTKRGATVVQPNPVDHARYSELLFDYRNATMSLLPVMHRLQGNP